MKPIYRKRRINKKIYNILFISHSDNYFINTTPSFYRMYKNLIFFHKHPNYNVIVLQPKRENRFENKKLKNKIKTFYYKDISILRNRFVHFTDLNPFFISKVIKILKKYQIDLIHVDYCYGINILKLLTDIPISYNAYNVEYIYFNQVGKNYFKIPPFLRCLYKIYIFFIEKYAIRAANIINAFSLDDMNKFKEIYNVPPEKLFINAMGYKEEIYDKPLNKISTREELRLDKNKFIVLFHGSYFNNYANQEAISIISNYILPKINDEEIQFIIAGNMPHFKDKKNLKFLGFVKDLKTLLYTADIAIVPILRASGIRIKMIDYLSAQLPMISTKKAKWGLKFENNIHGFIVSEENLIEEIVEKIRFFKNNPEIINLFKSNIRNLLEEYYNWDNILNSLEKKYRTLIQS